MTTVPGQVSSTTHPLSAPVPTHGASRSQVKSLSRNTSFSGNLKGAKSVSDIESVQHARDAQDLPVVRLPRPCSRQNNASRTDLPRSVSFSNEEGRHRQRAGW